jgi:hypothetical protein
MRVPGPDRRVSAQIWYYTVWNTLRKRGKKGGFENRNRRKTPGEDPGRLHRSKIIFFAEHI